MMRKLKLVVIAGLAFFALPALAEPPDDILGLLGAPVSSAEGKMQAKGYAEAGGTHWWNSKTGVCVTVGVANGHFRTIDTVAALDCGIKAMEQSGGGSASEPSKAAMDACMDSADNDLEEAIGTSVIRHSKRDGENWLITLNTDGHTSYCTVTEAGDVIQMEP